MMEPLSAFFILEGVAFGIFGTIFVVVGIISPKWNEDDVKPMYRPFTLFQKMVNDQNKEFDEFHQWILTRVKTQTITIDQTKEYKEIMKSMMNQEKRHQEFFAELHIKLIPSIIIMQMLSEKKINAQKVSQGFSCLIGGFFFQGIGVITQLIV